MITPEYQLPRILAFFDLRPAALLACLTDELLIVNCMEFSCSASMVTLTFEENMYSPSP